jgi:hypothetical protein
MSSTCITNNNSTYVYLFNGLFYFVSFKCVYLKINSSFRISLDEATEQMKAEYPMDISINLYLKTVSLDYATFKTISLYVKVLVLVKYEEIITRVQFLFMPLC